MKEMEKERLNDILDFARKGEIFCRKISEDNRNPDLLKEYYRGKAKAFREILEFIDEEGISGPITQIKVTNNENSIDNSNRGDGIDIVFAPEKKVGWINIYRSTTLETVCSPGCVFNTEEEALCHQTTRVMKYLGTCKIEWEE